jgi:hypothetical protein
MIALRTGGEAADRIALVRFFAVNLSTQVSGLEHGPGDGGSRPARWRSSTTATLSHNCRSNSAGEAGTVARLFRSRAAGLPHLAPWRHSFITDPAEAVARRAALAGAGERPTVHRTAALERHYRAPGPAGHG